MEEDLLFSSSILGEATESGWMRIIPSVHNGHTLPCADVVENADGLGAYKIVNRMTGESLSAARHNLIEAEVSCVHQWESRQPEKNSTFYKLGRDIDGRTVICVALHVDDDVLRRKLVSYHFSGQIPMGFNWTDEDFSNAMRVMQPVEIEQIVENVRKFDHQHAVLALDMLPYVMFDVEVLPILARLPIKRWVAIDTGEMSISGGRRYPRVLARGIPRTHVPYLIGTPQGGYHFSEIPINSEPYHPHDMVSYAKFGCRTTLIPVSSDNFVNAAVSSDVVYLSENELYAVCDNVIVGVHSRDAMRSQVYKLSFTASDELYHKYRHSFDPVYTANLECISEYYTRVNGSRQSEMAMSTGGSEEHAAAIDIIIPGSNGGGNVDVDNDDNDDDDDDDGRNRGRIKTRTKRVLSDMDDSEVLANVTEYNKRRALQSEKLSSATAGADRIMFKFKRT